MPVFAKETQAFDPQNTIFENGVLPNAFLESPPSDSIRGPPPLGAFASGIKSQSQI